MKLVIDIQKKHLVFLVVFMILMSGFVVIAYNNQYRSGDPVPRTDLAPSIMGHTVDEIDGLDQVIEAKIYEVMGPLFCGDNVKQPWEACDDGGTDWYSGDCAADCSSKNLFKVIDDPYAEAVGVGSIVHSGQEGTGDLAVPYICQHLWDAGKSDSTQRYTDGVHADWVQGYCPRRGVGHFGAWDANDPSHTYFYIGSCWGGHDIWSYTQVYCKP